MKLDYVRLLVNKFDECFRFYRDVMGFKVTWGMEGWSYASFNAGAIRLSIFKRQLMARDVGTGDLPSDATCQDRVALIFGVKNLDATVKRLEERGAQFITRPINYPDYGIRSAHFRDPTETLSKSTANYRKLSGQKSSAKTTNCSPKSSLRRQAPSSSLESLRSSTRTSHPPNEVKTCSHFALRIVCPKASRISLVLP